MLTLSQALQEMLKGDGFLNFGISHGLMNLTQTAAWIKPLIETRLGKSISTSALLMALSRMVKMKKKIMPQRQNIKLTRVTVHNGLSELTFIKTPSLLKRLERIQSLVQREQAYVAITQAVNDVTIIVDRSLEKEVRHNAGSTPIFYKNNIAALDMQFDPKYTWSVGFVYYILQQVVLQNINILEFSSTYTELIFYLDEKDLRLAFDTVYAQFME